MEIPTFLKWAGGKRHLIDQIDSHIPPSINNYFEPFLGGGFVFFYVKQKYNPKKCFLSDINKDLVNSFIAVRDDPKKLIKHLQNLRKSHSQEFYYKVRSSFNKNKFAGIKRAAIFIYLNKTCFNGLYRVNSKGEFNVPIGNYKNPEIFNEKTILLANKLLQGVKIVHQDYERILPLLNKEDFVYLDPCYDPLKKTSFVSYTPNKFRIEDRERLFQFMLKARRKKANLMLSNNNIRLVKEMYLDQKFKVETIMAKRFINSNPLGRGQIKELLITS